MDGKLVKFLDGCPMSDEKTIIADAANLSILSNTTKKPQACLVQYSGAGLGKRYQFDDHEVTLGRNSSSHIYINEASVSRSHAVFYVSDQQIFVEDKGSSNGTYVNERKVEGKQALKDQDMIRAGSILLKFFADNSIDSIIQDKIYRMATIDAGTQIFNKQYLIDTLTSELRFSKSYRRPLSIIYFDLDHFKPVNDNYGHNAGDQILREGAEIVKKMVRKDDVFARFGGEEFIIVLPNTAQEVAGELAERVRKRFEDHRFKLVNGKGQTIEHQQTVSLGVAQLDSDMEKYEELLEAADKKLYISKHTGRNKVTM